MQLGRMQCMQHLAHVSIFDITSAGILVVVAGVVWAHCLGDEAKDRVMDVMEPVLAG